MRKIWSVNIIITAASRVIRKKIPENNGNIWVDTALTTIDHLVEKGNKLKKRYVSVTHVALSWSAWSDDLTRVN